MSQHDDSSPQGPDPRPQRSVRSRHEDIKIQEQIDRLEQALVSFAALLTTGFLLLGLSLPVFRIVGSEDGETARLWTLWAHAFASGTDRSDDAPAGGVAGVFLLLVLVLAVAALVTAVRQHGREIGRRGLIVAFLTAPLLLGSCLILTVWMQRLGWTAVAIERSESSGPILVLGSGVWWLLAGSIAFAATVWAPALRAIWADPFVVPARPASDDPGTPRVRW